MDYSNRSYYETLDFDLDMMVIFLPALIIPNSINSFTLFPAFWSDHETFGGCYNSKYQAHNNINNVIQDFVGVRHNVEGNKIQDFAITDIFVHNSCISKILYGSTSCWTAIPVLTEWNFPLSSY